MAREEITPSAQAPALLRIEWFKYCERGSEYRTESHIHRYYQWYHCVRGDVVGRVDGKPFELSSGQSMLFAAASSREYGAGRRPPAYFVTVFETSPPLDVSSICSRLLQMPAMMEPDMQALIDEARKPREDCGLLVQALVLRLMLGFKRIISDERASVASVSSLTRGYNHEMVHRIELFLRQNFHQPITREDIAAHLSMSPGHVARLYRSVTGQTLVDRITQIRIESAKNLLLNSTLTVSQIALEVGYGSFSHFSKTFKDLEKVSPGDYRRSRGMSWEKHLDPSPLPAS
ncbi:MAG TPA: helix-turn-helix transcriptional regulator [Planctomycetota bacterium]|nr:helix-turn-helix transcriptional regulator [Planctomycetota bacterium]